MSNAMSNNSLLYNPFLHPLCIHQLFELQAAQSPEAIALVFEDRQLTYAQLNARADHLAQLLIAKGIKQEELVAICVERSFDMIVGSLAILKAGGAYVPLDPDYPAERLAFMLNDTEATILLTQTTLKDRLPKDSKAQHIYLDRIPHHPISKSPHQQITPSANQLAYTIYTSGSTGQPKGVQIEHHSVVNLVAGQMKFVKQPVQRFLYAYSFAFDGAVLLIWWTLLQGATLIIAPEDLEKDIFRLATFIDKHRITHLLTFPAVYTMLLQQNKAKLVTLLSVSVAGEACPAAMVRQHHQKLPNVRLLNQYGPTEATVGATIFITPPDLKGNKVPIGQPIENVRIYLLDEALKEVAVGETGEIYIGGKGVARGYLKRPELNKQRFLTDPFSPIVGARMYKSGDLARRLPDGNIDFIGRRDQQVKLRGYRIELGEVEAVILQQPEVQASVVMLRGEAANKQLVAYVVWKKGSDGQPPQLREQLARQLPDYMVPARFVVLDELPISTSGKVDRKALPLPGRQRPDLGQAYTAPHTPLQKHLAAIWAEVLELEKVGIHDRFFELGGNSLLAAGMISRLQQWLNETIFIVSLFDKPTIADYARFLEKEYPTALAQKLDNVEKLTTTTPQHALSDVDFNSFTSYIPRLRNKSAEQPDKNPPAIFILAPPRSGTTLLRVMLAGHPALFAANELQLLGFNTLAEREKAYQGKYSLWAEGLIRAVMELKNCDPEEARLIIRQFTEAGYSTRQMFAELQSWLDGRLLVDKSPSYALDPQALQKAECDFEGALYIHLLRHPYAMIRSFERMHLDQAMYLHPHPYTGSQLAELIWAHSHQTIASFLESISVQRQFRLKYEELVTQPEAVMRQLCARFDLPYSPQLIKPYEGIENKMTDGLYEQSKPMGDVRLLDHKKINPTLAEAWKGVLNDNFLHKQTWQIAQQLGYPNVSQTADNEPVTSLSATSTHTDIAIIGMSARLPGAENVQQFWQNLASGVDVSRVFSEQELRAAGISEADYTDPDYVKRGMALKDYDCFDATFFGYTPKEAALMDPQHRIFLECAWAALEDAAYDPERYDGVIGLMGGVARNTYLVNNVLTHPNYFQSIEDFTKGITQEKDFPATRAAYKLNLTGPAVNIQTACSSSGVAVHLACQSLLNGDADIMLVGGGRIQPPVESGHLHTDGHALSPDGFCRPFDASADGMVRGNGMAFIVIKSLEQAIKDGDTIHAVIKATAINNDGQAKIGYTAPSVEGQASVIEKTYRKAGISPNTISYIEAHGTGTRIGDPIEIAGLTKAFRQFTTRNQFCAIGSVKSNIGHLDAGACVAGIIKTVLAMQHRQLPATLHYSQPNSQIEFSKTPFFVNDHLQDWSTEGAPLRAGVSSFGLGGTNAHILLEEAPLIKRDASPASSHQLILLSAKDPPGLQQSAVRLATALKENPNYLLADVTHSLQTGRKFFEERLFVVADSLAAASEILHQNDLTGISTGRAAQQPKVAFLFPGGGAQHSNMGLELYRELPTFRAAVDQCLELLETEYDLSLKAVLYPPGSQESKPITDPLHAITLLFTIEYATARLWQSWGIQPSQLLGHSLGEYTAACLAGVFSLKDALGIVTCRGKLFQKLPKGAMLSVALSERELSPYLSEQLDVAVVNKPDNCVLSGSEDAIEKVQQQLEALDIQCSRLHIDVAAHSHMVEAIMNEFEVYLNTIEYRPPQFPILSNSSGKWADPEAICQPAYWLRHLRQPVRFSDGLAHLLKQERVILLETGPGQSLSTFARQHPARQLNQPVIASLRHPREQVHDFAFLLKSLGQLWLQGADIDWQAFREGQHVQRVSLPGYPFERQRHWIAPKPLKSLQKSTDFPFKEHIRTAISHSNMESIKVTRKDLVLKQLKNIFHQLSGIPQAELAPHSSFLELGFDSLFLTQVTSQIKKQLKVKISFRQLFEDAPNLASLAQLVDGLLPASALQDELASANEVEVRPATPLEAEFVEPIQKQTEEPAAIQWAGGSVEAIVERQLRLMEQQLKLLNKPRQKVGNTSVHTNRLRTQEKELSQKEDEKVAKPAAAVEEQDFVKLEKGQKAHGPWKSIDAKKEEGLNEQQGRYLAQLIEQYTARTKSSQQLAQQQRSHLADPRSIVGFNRLWKDMIYQIAVDHSQGSKIWDIDGNEYVDYRMSFGISLFGHSPDFVREAIRAQTSKGFELGINTPLASQVAKLLCELSGMDRATLVNTGSEAVSAAIRAARTATGKDRIAVFEGDYHGIADELLVRAVSWNGHSKAIPIAPGIPEFLVENVLVLDYDDPDVLEKIRVHTDELAAVLIEPIQPNFPQRQPRELLHQIRRLTQEEDIALIFDEMITGFRLAMRGAQEWYGVEADLVAYGKIISGGLPMAAVAGKSRFMDCFDGGQWRYGDDSFPEAGVTFFGGTFVKHPLSLAASFAALSEIKKQGATLFDELNAKTARFANRLKDLFEHSKVPLQLASTASIISIKVMDTNPLARLFFYFLKLKGVHWLEKAALLSAAHTEEDLQFTYEAIEESIREMQTAGFFKINVRESEMEHFLVPPPNRAALSSTNGKQKLDLLKENIPLTEGQKEVWVEQQLGDEAAAAYNLSSDIVLKGELQIDSLRHAIHQLIDRHEALRTYFDQRKTVQHIRPSLLIDIPLTDLSECSEEERQQEISQLLEKEMTIPLDLFSGPLIRASIIRLQAKLHRLILTVHHGIADGWSCGILARDLGELYSAACEGRPARLAVAKQLSEFAAEQQAASEEQAEAGEYWAAQFADGVPVLELPTDHRRPSVKTYNAAFEKITLSTDQLQRLKALAAKEGSTLFVMLYAAFSSLLHRLSGQEDFVLGLVAAGQSIAGNQDTVAHGVSLLPVRVKAVGSQPFSAFLKTIRAKVLDAFDHQHYTLGSLVKRLKLQRDPSRQPIISILFNMDSEMELQQFTDLEVQLNPIIRKYETFDIFVNMKVGEAGIDLEWTYNTDLFDKTTIQRRLQEFEVLIESLLRQPETPIGKLDLLTAHERQLLLNDWVATDHPYPADQCVHQLIEKQAAQTPHRIAVQSGETSLSYRQLNEQANQLAQLLHRRAVKKGDFVGIYMERSVDLLLGLLAILKAGGIYVPLDPANPPDRLRVILQDAEARVLLTHERLMHRLPEGPKEIICLEKTEAELRVLPTENPDFLTDSTVSAYIIYTSGSTGRPKGVIIPHYAVVDHHLAMIAAKAYTPEHVLLSVASVSFDPSVQDFFMPLFIGSQVVIASQEEVVDGFLLKERIRKSGISYMQATPATWRLLLSAGWEGQAGMTVVSVGEGITRPMAIALRERCSRLFNAYGPSETTIYTTVRNLDEVAQEPLTISGYEPVGWPLYNVQVYILDRYMQPVPIGVTGEIYVGGVGVAPGGYFKRPTLNNEKFVPNPFAPDKSPRLYRSGDLGRYREDGDIDFMGRADHQVKLRGFRIELGEIEALLSQYDGIRENVVIVREDKEEDKRLVAYVILEEGFELDTRVLRFYLKKQLPEYMLPSAFVEMEAFPLTATLKVDRKRLPVPVYSRDELESGYLAPSTKTERLLLKIWSALLNVEPIGVKDNFFDLGGHSLIAVKMMAAIAKATGSRLPLASLLENPTIRSLSYLIDHSNGQYKSNSLIPIKSSGSRLPIYLVHGAGLHVLMFQTLAQYMDAEQPIYALQARGLDGEAPPLDRIEDIAAHYISEILKQNPNGPYALAGYSFGGLIAFEMAKQLKQKGKEVAMLGVFDTVVRANVAGEEQSYYQQLATLGKKVSWNLSLLAKEPITNLKYKSNTLQRRYRRWKWRLTKGEQKELSKNGISTDYEALVDRMNQKAFENYRLSPYDGKIHLFRAKDQRFYVQDFEYLGWKPFAKKGIELHEVPGDHLNLFNPPHGKAFAEILQACLNQIDNFCADNHSPNDTDHLHTFQKIEKADEANHL